MEGRSLLEFLAQNQRCPQKGGQNSPSVPYTWFPLFTLTLPGRQAAPQLPDPPCKTRQLETSQSNSLRTRGDQGDSPALKEQLST